MLTTPRETFVMPSGDGGHSVLFASKIREHVEAKKVRLSVIIIDCCNTLHPINRSFALPAAVEWKGVPQVTPLFDRLFFEPTGTVVIESSSAGEYAVILPQLRQIVQAEFSKAQEEIKLNQGSLFTSCLGDFLNDPKLTTLHLSWAVVCRQTQLRMDAMFTDISPHGQLVLGSGKIVEQNSQNIMAWINGNRVAVR